MFKLDPILENDTVYLGQFALCQVLLMNDCQYPWLILVPQVADVSEIYQLSKAQRQLLEQESNFVAKTMSQLFNADKMNIAALGNVVAQLHIHHIVRFKTDTAWPAPIWGKLPVKPYSEEKLLTMKTKLLETFRQNPSFTQ